VKRARRLPKSWALKSYYGNVALIKKFCPQCRAISIVIDGKCSDCGMGLNLAEVKRCRLKRESLTESIRHKPPAHIQKEILSHQNNQCIYCGLRLDTGREINWDHFIPFVFGETSDRNWVASCRECNSFKSSYLFNSVDEAQIYIQNKRLERGLINRPYFGGSYEVAKI